MGGGYSVVELQIPLNITLHLPRPIFTAYINKEREKSVENREISRFLIYQIF